MYLVQSIFASLCLPFFASTDFCLFLICCLGYLADWRRMYPPDTLVFVSSSSIDKQFAHNFAHCLAFGFGFRPSWLFQFPVPLQLSTEAQIMATRCGSWMNEWSFKCLNKWLLFWQSRLNAKISVWFICGFPLIYLSDFLTLNIFHTSPSYRGL